MRQTNYIVMVYSNSTEGSTKIVNFMTPGVGVLMQGQNQVRYEFYRLRGNEASITNICDSAGVWK